MLLLNIIIIIVIIIIINCFTWKRPVTIRKTKIKRERGLKRSVICMRRSLKLTQRRQVGRSRGKKGAPSLFENCPLKKRRHENTSELLRRPCILAHVRFLHDLHPMQCSLTSKNKSYFLVQGTCTGAVFCKMSVQRRKNCLEFSIPWGWLRISRWPFHSCTIFEAYL